MDATGGRGICQPDGHRGERGTRARGGSDGGDTPRRRRSRGNGGCAVDALRRPRARGRERRGGELRGREGAMSDVITAQARAGPTARCRRGARRRACPPAPSAADVDRAAAAHLPWVRRWKRTRRWFRRGWHAVAGSGGQPRVGLPGRRPAGVSGGERPRHLASHNEKPSGHAEILLNRSHSNVRKRPTKWERGVKNEYHARTKSRRSD